MFLESPSFIKPGHSYLSRSVLYQWQLSRSQVSAHECSECLVTETPLPIWDRWRNQMIDQLINSISQTIFSVMHWDPQVSCSAGNIYATVVCFVWPICRSCVSVCLTHWGRVTHICVINSIIIGSDNGLSPGRRQAIIWTNTGILLIGPLGTNFSEILIEI